MGFFSKVKEKFVGKSAKQNNSADWAKTPPADKAAIIM